MVRTIRFAVALVAAFSTAGIPLAHAQTQPGQPAGGQPAGSQAQERSQGAVGGWLWPILGLAVLGGVVAAAAGSGGGGGGGTTSAPSTTTR